MPEVVEQLKPEDFYLRQNREIYETIYSMFNFSQTIDPVTVLDQMRQNGVYDENTSRNYILQLMDDHPHGRQREGVRGHRQGQGPAAPASPRPPAT